eukprot:m.307267 g.307267  ORF g.307267 m.307267 type:complete len:566 (-) comp19854_c0_seq1:73-1770(-)
MCFQSARRSCGTLQQTLRTTWLPATLPSQSAITPPALTCPSNIDTAISSAPQTVSWTPPVPTDNLGGDGVTLVASHASGSSFALGTTTVTYTATDAAGNKATCSFSITLTDEVGPVFSGCPDPVLVSTAPEQAFAVVSWTPPTVTDTLDSAPVVTVNRDSGSQFFVGSSVVVYEAQDSAGNVAHCRFDVVVSDAEPPRFLSCPIGGKLTGSGTCDVYLSDFGVSDNVAVVSVTSNLKAPTGACAVNAHSKIQHTGSVDASPGASVTLTAVDAAGNRASCSFVLVSSVSLDEVILPTGRDAAVYPGDVIELQGSGLGASQQDIESITVDGVQCASFTWHSPSRITCVAGVPLAPQRYGGGWTHVLTFASSAVLSTGSVSSGSSFKLSDSSINSLAGSEGLELWIDQRGYPLFWHPTNTDGSKRNFQLTSHVGRFRFSLDDTYSGPCGHDAQNTNYYFFFFKSNCAYNSRSCSCESGNYENAVYSESGFTNRDGSSFFKFEGWDSEYRMYARPLETRNAVGHGSIAGGNVALKLKGRANTLETTSGSFPYACHLAPSDPIYQSRGRC